MNSLYYLFFSLGSCLLIKEYKDTTESNVLDQNFENKFCHCKQEYDPDQFMIRCQICLEYYHLDHIGLENEECEKVSENEELGLMVCPACLGKNYLFLESYENDLDVVVNLKTYQKSAKKPCKGEENVLADHEAKINEKSKETSEEAKENTNEIDKIKEINENHTINFNSSDSKVNSSGEKVKTENAFVSDQNTEAIGSPSKKPSLKRKPHHCAIDWSYLDQKLTSIAKKPMFLKENWTENICLCDECQKNYKKIGLDDVIKTCDQNVKKKKIIDFPLYYIYNIYFLLFTFSFYLLKIV